MSIKPYTPPPTVPCRVCGEETHATTIKICAGCWEVESRIHSFVRHPEGRRIVEEALAQAGGDQERERIVALIQNGIDECRCGEPGTLFYNEGAPCECCKERARVLGEIHP